VIRDQMSREQRLEMFAQELRALSNKYGFSVTAWDAIDDGAVLEELEDGQEVIEYYWYGIDLNDDCFVLGVRTRDKQIRPVCSHDRCELYGSGEGDQVCKYCQYRSEQ